MKKIVKNTIGAVIVIFVCIVIVTLLVKLGGEKGQVTSINKQTQKITTVDSFELVADLYKPDYKNAKKNRKLPAVILLSPYMVSRTIYSDLSAELCENEMIVLSLDVRNTGESVNVDEKEINFGEFANVHLDAEAAIKYIKTIPSVDTTKIAILGTSMTTRSALLAAGKKKNIKAAVLVSAVLDSTGLDIIQETPFRPILVTVSIQDGPAGTQARDIYEASSNPNSKINSYLNAGKGAQIWISKARPEMQSLIVRWLNEQLYEK